MKKSLIALAVLASVASAQAEVTVYGIADIWVGRTSATSDAGVKTDDTKLESGGLAGSRVGVKGGKDLSLGLKGVFKLEQGFNLDTGKTNNNDGQDPAQPVVDDATFSREAYVGLEGGFGQILLGKTWTAMDGVLGASNSGFDSGLSATNGVFQIGGEYSSNPGNTIKYTAPSFAGMTFVASHSLNEGDATVAKVSDFSLSYAVGSLAANVAYQQQKTDGADTVKLTTLNGSYDLGVVKLLASTAMIKEGTNETTESQIGVDVPVTSALTLSVGYAMSEDNAAKGGKERSGFGVAAGYKIGESTTVYGGARQAKEKVGSVKDSLIAVGINHAF